MRVIYIAGKFRGATPWQVEQNVRAAEAAALEVWRAGCFALCPHTNTRHFDKELPDEVFLAGTLEMLRRSDAILLIPGWTRSQGALAELEEARRLGLAVFGVRGENDCEEQPLDEAITTLCTWSRQPHESVLSRVLRRIDQMGAALLAERRAKLEAEEADDGANA